MDCGYASPADNGVFCVPAFGLTPFGVSGPPCIAPLVTLPSRGSLSPPRRPLLSDAHPQPGVKDPRSLPLCLPPPPPRLSDNPWINTERGRGGGADRESKRLGGGRGRWRELVS